MAAGKLEIIVLAKLDRLEADLRKVEQRVNQTNNQITGGMAKSFDKVVGSVTKLVSLFAILEVAVVAISLNMRQWQASMALINGDWEGIKAAVAGYLEDIRSIPIIGTAIGGVADRISHMIGEFDGTNDKMRQLNRMMRLMAANAPFQQMLVNTSLTNQKLERQIEILKEQDFFARERLVLQDKIMSLEDQMLLVDVEIQRATEAQLFTRQQLLQARKVELERQKEILELESQQRIEAENTRRAAEAAREAERQALAKQRAEAEAERERERKAREDERRALEGKRNLLSKLRDITNSMVDGLRKANQADQNMLSRVQGRLGAMASNAAVKSGFTNQASTAMGTFVFGEQNFQAKIQQMTQEQNRIQQTMAGRLQIIEGLMRKMAENFGFR